jgi:hypothetical protein
MDTREQRYYSKDHAGRYREGFLAHGSMSSKYSTQPDIGFSVFA